MTLTSDNHRARNWCFTLNNWTEEEYEKLQNYPSKYIVIGKEIGENRTPHLQGYVEFESPKAMKTLKTFNKRLHLEKRKGTAKQASDYCKKDNDYWENGNITNQGRRTDIEELGQDILGGKKVNEIREENPGLFMKYRHGIIDLCNYKQKDRDPNFPPKIYWIWGQAGSGKTSFITAKHKPDEYFIKDGSMWWDKYNQEKIILIDDFNGKWEFRDFLRLLDRNKYSGQIKGGYVKINSPYIIVTCEFEPEHYWANNELAQVKRRITKIINIEIDNILDIEIE